MSILDLIFPKYCVNCKKLGDYLCADCFSFLSFNDFELCLNCNRPSIDGLTHPYCKGKYLIDGAFSALNYKGVVKKLVYNFKYEPKFVSDLNNTLVNLFYEALIQKESFAEIYELFKNDLILVPVPLYLPKLKKRGYNQSELLAKGLSKRFGIPLFSVLERTKNTKTQVGLKKEERKENIKDAFKIKTTGIKDLSDKSLFLVDDVLTTGSTLLEAANVLKRNGAKNVWGITLAKD
ncbi:MAG: hypothetical protein A3H79_00615 [Candidatus Levybacteria bacterium RIFCSPLOWO2_02_FULL_36_8b]|nr:MAG: hypothetical protein A3H79_00615 [Candidatus Levybacteria bacterium RIFCSPLOWO2_02_FULL_36_8b]